MFDQFNEYIAKMKGEGDAAIRANYVQEMLGKLQDPKEVRAALDQGEPSILSQLIALDNLEVLKAIVALCDFKDHLLFLKQPGYLVLKLMTLHTGTNKPEFPGFNSVAEAVFKTEITGADAKKHYATLVDTYYIGKDNETFKAVINELLTQGTTTQTIGVPERKDVRKVLCDLLASRVQHSYTRERLKQYITMEVEIPEQGSFAEQGAAIIAKLESKHSAISNLKKFTEIAKSFCTEQLDLSGGTTLNMDASWYSSKVTDIQGSRERKLRHILHTPKFLEFSDIYASYAYGRDRIWVPTYLDAKVPVDYKTPLYDKCNTLADFINQQVLAKVDDFGLEANDEFLTKFNESPRMRFIKEVYKNLYGQDLGMLLTEERVDALLNPNEKAGQKWSDRMQPGYLAAQLTERYGNREFPGFDFVAQMVQKGELSEEEAIKQYPRLVEIYFSDTYRFNIAIKDLLTTGSTAQGTISEAERRNSKDALCELVDKIFGHSYNREALKQIIIRVNITGKRSFADQGKAIIEELATKGYTEKTFEVFIRMAKALYMEQPEYTNQTWNINFSQPPILGSSKGTEEEKLHSLLYKERLLDWSDIALSYVYAAYGRWLSSTEESTQLYCTSYNRCRTLAEFVNQHAQDASTYGLKDDWVAQNKKLKFIKTLYKAAYGEDLSTKITTIKLDHLLKSAQVVANTQPVTITTTPSTPVARSTKPLASTNLTVIALKTTTTTNLTPTVTPKKEATTNPEPPMAMPKEESSNTLICLKLLSIAVFTYATYQSANVASSKLSGRLPDLTNLPKPLRNYGQYCSLLALPTAGIFATTFDAVALLVCLASAASSIVSYKEDYKPALVTLAAITMGIINYVATKDQSNGSIR